MKHYLCHSELQNIKLLFWIFWKTSAPTVCLILNFVTETIFRKNCMSAMILSVVFFLLTEESSVWCICVKTNVSFPWNNFLSSSQQRAWTTSSYIISLMTKKKNRGFCFLEYEDHKTAAQARRRLMSGKVKVWGNVVTVEWADPIEDPDPEVMAKVRCFPRTALVQQ